MHVTIEDEYLAGVIEGFRQKPRYPVQVERKFIRLIPKRVGFTFQQI